MKTVKVGDELHARFKAVCALRGVKMQDAVAEALGSQLIWWEYAKGREPMSGDLIELLHKLTIGGPAAEMATLDGGIEIVVKKSDVGIEDEEK